MLRSAWEIGRNVIIEVERFSRYYDALTDYHLVVISRVRASVSLPFHRAASHGSRTPLCQYE